MSSVRTLPIRVAPVSGEALDSWLEAIAHRTNTMHADLLSAVGLKAQKGMGISTWMVQPAASEIESLSVATSLRADLLESMVLPRYSERALRISPDGKTLSRTFPWGRGRGSRFCPKCLEETDGRWQLSWRLGWAFACIVHNCLLADACPECRVVQRLRTHIGDVVPQPGRCAHPARDAVGRAPERCGADLTTVSTVTFDAEHPVVRAQQIINAVIESETAAFGVYRLHPQPRINVLSDIRAVAGRILAYATTEDLKATITPDLLVTHQSVDERQPRRYAPAQTDAKPGLAAPARAATAAVGAVGAIDVLNSSDVFAAGDSLRWLIISSRDRGSAVSATNIAWGKNTTPVLSAVQLAALGPLLKPSDQLRHRVGTALPNRPTADKRRAEVLAQGLPTMLWRAWSLRMAIPDSHQRQLRPALSSALLLVNSRLNLDEAATMIDSPLDGHAVSRVLQLLEKQAQWDGLRLGLIRMADYLVDCRSPIDYRRRRQLDYSMLLPDKVWTQICRDTGTPGVRSIRARIARSLLFERLSGLPASASSIFPDSNAFRTQVADFPRYLTTELHQALDKHAQEFLADQGVSGEPAVWEPPAAVLDGLDLPGDDPGKVKVEHLHRAATTDGNKMGATAKLLNASLDTVRYLLEIHPPPPPVRSGTTPYNRAYVTAKAALPRERLLELYERQHMSLRDIAESVGVSRQVVGRIARDYDLALREPGLKARTIIERDWLHDQYVNKRRTLPDLAKETGMSTANMARWAKTHGIPLRARGGPSHSSAMAAADDAADAPELLRPVLAGVGGRGRLERFVAASSFSTLTAAAENLGIHQFTLVNQINRIERELATKLFIRAERGRPMQLTDDGERVVEAVRAYKSRGQT